MGYTRIARFNGDLYIEGNIYPTKDDTFNLGKSGVEFKDAHIDGVGYIDSISPSVGGAQVVTGSFSGDNNATQAITGLGIAPDIVFIYCDSQLHSGYWIKTDQMTTSTYWLDLANTWINYDVDVIISLDADGFTVGDGNEMNDIGISYKFIAIEK